MNKAQKEVMQAFLDNEKETLKQIEENYQDALAEIGNRIMLLKSREDADMQHVIYQIEYQQALKKQTQAILDQLHNNEFETVSEYLTKCYEEGYVGTLYDLQYQGVPLMMPIDQAQVVAAIQHETKLSEGLYTALGKDIKELQKKISSEISRGISNGQMYSEIARNISSYAMISKNNAMRIARTEGHRIQCKSASDAQWKAKEHGADIVKRWDASLDSKTRPEHAQLDGQIRELDEYYEVAGYRAMEPSGFGAPEMDINCRCQSISKARWLLDADETKYIGDTSKMTDEQLEPIANKLGMTTDELRQYKDEIIPVKAKNYEDFKEQYNKIWKYEGSDLQKEAEARIAGYKNGDSSVRSNVQKMNENAEQRLAEKGIQINIADAGKHLEEVNECLEHLDILTNEYNSTVVSYSVGKVSGTTTEYGSAYMYNGKTSILVDPRAYRVNKATDDLGLGEKQPLGITYHEFAHSLSQSREKTDSEFWKEIRKVKKEYEGMRNENNWFDVKISNYASKDVDEFIAESFTQAKLADEPSPYAVKVLEVIDKYFKKETLENVGKSSTMKVDLQLFAEKDIANQSSNSLKRAIRKYEANILDHEDKISNPEKYITDWNSKDIREQKGLVKHWQKEIRNFNQSIDDRIDELKNRGDYNG